MRNSASMRPPRTGHRRQPAVIAPVRANLPFVGRAAVPRSLPRPDRQVRYEQRASRPGRRGATGTGGRLIGRRAAPSRAAFSSTRRAGRAGRPVAPACSEPAGGYAPGEAAPGAYPRSRSRTRFSSQPLSEVAFPTRNRHQGMVDVLVRERLPFLDRVIRTVRVKSTSSPCPRACVCRGTPACAGGAKSGTSQEFLIGKRN